MFSRIPPPRQQRQHQGGARRIAPASGAYCQYQVQAASWGSNSGARTNHGGASHPAMLTVCVHVGIALKPLQHVVGGQTQFGGAPRSVIERIPLRHSSSAGLSATATASSCSSDASWAPIWACSTPRLPRPAQNPPTRAPHRCGCRPTRHRPIATRHKPVRAKCRPHTRRRGYTLACSVSGGGGVMGGTFSQRAQALRVRRTCTGFVRLTAWRVGPIRINEGRNRLHLTFPPRPQPLGRRGGHGGAAGGRAGHRRVQLPGRPRRILRLHGRPAAPAAARAHPGLRRRRRRDRAAEIRRAASLRRGASTAPRTASAWASRDDRRDGDALRRRPVAASRRRSWRRSRATLSRTGARWRS